MIGEQFPRFTLARIRAATLLMPMIVALQNSEAADMIDLSNATIVTRAGDLSPPEQMAATVLVEEIESRTGIRLNVSTEWPASGAAIAISTTDVPPEWSRAPLPNREENGADKLRDGYRLVVQNSRDVWIIGADGRGALYGAGALLRNLSWAKGKAAIADDIDIATAPAYPIRGHQLGYRARANSWDAWTPEQFDQYIRELAFFGINSIENIPFQDERENSLMKLSRRDMNRELSAICARYGLDYWVWTPADFDLNDGRLRAAALDQHEQLYRDCEELTGVFFPGGDPGSNPPELVLPFLEDVSKRLQSIHPDARVWLSLQGFNRDHIKETITFLEHESPDWLGGLVAGPSSPPIPFTRNMLPAKYKYRLYPDITHNKLCQYPVPWWDQAFALTLGREAINPRPAQYAYIHNWFAPYSDGFISYSDGVHDDVNKTVWSSLGWDPKTDVQTILVEYCRTFFGPSVAEDAADGILALERNWRGSLRDNGAVEGTYLQWQRLVRSAPRLESNWRWQMCLVRAAYDTYVRRRLIHESALEDEANAILRDCGVRGADQAIVQAQNVLDRCLEEPVAPELRRRIVKLCEMLFESCALQTSVEIYNASGAERGAFLDFLDYPLNNRFWLEDEFAKVRAMMSEEDKQARLIEIASWEDVGPGSFYDDIGNPAKSPHVRRSEDVFTEPGEEAQPSPTYWWWDSGKSRERLSWQSSMNWPEAVVYEGLDPDGDYQIRTTGYGQCLLLVDDERIAPRIDGIEIGMFKLFDVPAHALDDRKLVLTWDHPIDEGELNWRQQSRLSEMWLLKR